MLAHGLGCKQAALLQAINNLGYKGAVRCLLPLFEESRLFPINRTLVSLGNCIFLEDDSE